MAAVIEKSVASKDATKDKPPASERDWTIEVEAYRDGTYPQPGALSAWYRRPGDHFLIRNKTHFAPEWMLMPGQTSGQEAAESRHEVPILGHGVAQDTSGLPQTTVANQVVDPLSIIGPDPAAAYQRGR